MRIRRTLLLVGLIAFVPTVRAQDRDVFLPTPPDVGTRHAESREEDDLHQRIDGLEVELLELRRDLAVRRPDPPSRVHETSDGTWVPEFPEQHSTTPPWATSSDENGTQYPTLKWSGFIQLDTGWIWQNEANVASVGDVDTQSGLRRTRLRASGKVREHTSYLVDLDFSASGHPSFRDVGFTMHDVPYIQNLQFGHFKTPFGMDAQTSGQEILFLERQSPFALDPFRQTGIGTLGTLGEQRGTYNAAVFLFPTDAYGVGTQGSGGYAFAARTTWLPVDDRDCHLVHVGAGYSLGDPSDNTVQYAIQPGFFVTDPDDPTTEGVPAFVDTGPIPTNLFHLFNLELALLSGPFRIQSETRISYVDRRGASAVSFPATYVQMGYVLTGETPDYDRDRGVFYGVIPRHEFGRGSGGGAWEATLGWSTIDLNDQDVHGGRMQVLIVGLNWYLNEHVRCTLNVLPIRLEDPGIGPSRAGVAAGRVQVAF